MAPESSAKPAPAAAPAPAPAAPSAIKPASSKTGIIIAAVIIGIVLLAGLAVGGYFLVATFILGQDSPFKNLGKSEEQIATEALDASAFKLYESMTSSSETVDAEQMAENVSPYLSTFFSGGGATSIPAGSTLFTVDGEEMDSFSVNYDMSLDSSADTLSAELQGKVSKTSNDDMEMTLNSSGAMDLNGTDLSLAADLTVREIDGDSYMLLENVDDDTIDIVAQTGIYFVMMYIGYDPSDMSAAELAQLDAMAADGADGFRAAYIDQWVMSEATEPSDSSASVDESEPLTDQQMRDLENLYSDTFGSQNAEYVGKETLEGETVYHWAYNLTSEDIDELLKTQCEILDEPGVSCADDSFSAIAELDNYEIWINDAGEMRKITGGLTIDMGTVTEEMDLGGIPISSDETLSFDGTIWLSDINGVSEISAPSDYITMDEASDIMMSYIEKYM